MPHSLTLTFTHTHTRYLTQLPLTLTHALSHSYLEGGSPRASMHGVLLKQVLGELLRLFVYFGVGVYLVFCEVFVCVCLVGIHTHVDRGWRGTPRKTRVHEETKR